MLFLHLAYGLMGVSISEIIDIGFTKSMIDTMISAAKEVNKPTALILHFNDLSTAYQASCEERELCYQAGLPVFSLFAGATRAMDRFLRYHGK